MKMFSTEECEDILFYAPCLRYVNICQLFLHNTITIYKPTLYISRMLEQINRVFFGPMSCLKIASGPSARSRKLNSA